MTSPRSRLDHLAVLRLTGPDRVALLQGQTSNDATRVEPGRAQLTSFNNPKGRCYAIALLAAWDVAHLLVTERSVAELLTKKLRMYVLRSKVQVEPATDLVACDAGRAAEGPAFASAIVDGRLEIGLPDGRALGIAPAASVGGLADGSAAWRRADVAAGLPSVVAATIEHFVPLWLGLERLGAIDYKKGCYTGQEIVARTHYLGTVKQRLLRARSPAAALPGDKLYDDAGQPVGEVVSAAADGADHAVLLATREAKAYRLGRADGPLLIDATPF